MLQRIVNPLKSDSFFIFGARGTGKSTYILSQFFSDYSPDQVWHLDLLNDDIFDRYSIRPSLIEADFKELKKKPEWIFIDEVQKIPKLLNHVHRMIEKQKQKFILTGSSARKLKVVGSNLLAGRAFLNFMYPFTWNELGSAFSLSETLHWGSLPKIFEASDDRKMNYLRSYVSTYIKEEVLLEHFIKNMEPFRNFLEVAAQMNGKIINFSKIGREVGCDDKTIKNYYSILEDTLIGFFLPAYHKSIRKGQAQHPKFYLFDIGVKRALERSLQDRFSSGTIAFGDAFEHFIVLEIYRLNSYLQLDYRISYFMTKEGREIDIVLSRGRKIIAIEIKSKENIDHNEVEKLSILADEVGATQKYYFSRDDQATQLFGVHCLPWQDGLTALLQSH